jgi:hypothetical protein
MDSPVRRRVAFAVIVCVLVALGAYLVGPFAHRQQPAGRRGPAAAASPRPGRLGSSAGTAPAADSTRPADSASPQPGQPDIYQWLPFTQAGLAGAAATVTRFGGAYGTYSYTEDASAYGNSLQPVASAALVGQIEAAYAAPGVASARSREKQVAVGSATIDSISAFGPTSLTFIVQVTQRLDATTGNSQQSSSYSVTVTGDSANWQVTSVELASLGNS